MGRIVLRFGLFRRNVRARDRAHSQRPSLRRRSNRRPNTGNARNVDGARRRKSLPRTVRSKRIWICSRGCEQGEFTDGEKVLRAKIDMASPNINMRDPVIYRVFMRIIIIRAINGASIRCTRSPIRSRMRSKASRIRSVRWSSRINVLSTTGSFGNARWSMGPHQYEFARLNLTNTVMSKRKLKQLVDEKVVDGWDDPRMPTISGLRRKGYTPEAIRAFCREIGVAKSYSVVDERMLEHFIREDLKLKALRTMAVLESAKGRHHELSGRSSRMAGRREQFGESGNGRASNSVLPRDLHRTGRFHGESAAEIFPACSPATKCA